MIVVYSNWMILFCPNGAFMSSTSAVHSVWFFPNILDMANIACHYIYYVTGFTMKISYYGIWMVIFVRDDLGGIHVDASQASWLITRLGKFGLWLGIYFWFYKHLFQIWAFDVCYFLCCLVWWLVFLSLVIVLQISLRCVEGWGFLDWNWW